MEIPYGSDRKVGRPKATTVNPVRGRMTRKANAVGAKAHGKAQMTGPHPLRITGQIPAELAGPEREPTRVRWTFDETKRDVSIKVQVRHWANNKFEKHNCDHRTSHSERSFGRLRCPKLAQRQLAKGGEKRTASAAENLQGHAGWRPQEGSQSSAAYAQGPLQHACQCETSGPDEHGAKNSRCRR